jgi:hypothetical protein
MKIYHGMGLVELGKIRAIKLNTIIGKHI